MWRTSSQTLLERNEQRRNVRFEERHQSLHAGQDVSPVLQIYVCKRINNIQERTILYYF
jgi:hypothetical protein